MLVVEDDPDHLELTLSALEESDSSHHIVIARNGREALDYLFGEGINQGRSTDDQPELVLLDLGMPEMNGLQVMEQNGRVEVSCPNCKRVVEVQVNTA